MKENAKLKRAFQNAKRFFSQNRLRVAMKWVRVANRITVPEARGLRGAERRRMMLQAAVAGISERPKHYVA